MKERSRNTLNELRAPSPYRTALLLALLVFLFSFTISSVFARSLQEQNDRDFQAKVTQQATSLQTHIDTSANSYHQLLFLASSLFAITPEPTRQDWQMFYQTSKIATTYPELLGVGFAPVVARENVNGFEQDIHERDLPNFTVAPTTSERDILTPILYLEPANAINTAVYGFDMSSDPIRRAAMEQARDNAQAVMTAPVHLAQDKGLSNEQTGVLVYYPVYQTGMIPDTLDRRRAEVRGYVYVVLHPSDLVRGYLKNHTNEYEQSTVKVVDITDEAHHLEVFSSAPSSVPYSIAVSDHEEEEISGRTWQVSVKSWNSVVQRSSPFVVFGLGTIVSLLLAWMIYRITAKRIEHITSTYEGEVQRTKDELLALASHQLRTPASGVKQYIGMLTSGIFGEMTPDQLSIAQKAYEANERQLEIINELLYVSKADAGQLVIEPKSFDMTRLVQKSADSFVEQAAHKNITILFPTKKEHRLVGDDRYIAMAVDNLISNAIKYSYPSSTVHIKVTSTRDDVKLSIRDRGVGISEESKETIFGKFNRADNPLSHSEGGSGLGLFLARQLARAHGGDITVDSVLEKGSTFTLTLPRELTINETIVNLDRVKRNEEEI